MIHTLYIHFYFRLFDLGYFVFDKVKVAYILYSYFNTSIKYKPFFLYIALNADVFYNYSSSTL